MTSHPRRSDSLRRRIETLSARLSLPTVRKALGLLEGDHPSRRRFGTDDIMDIRDYTTSDEARLIDWKASARVGRPMVIQRERTATAHIWMLMDVSRRMTSACSHDERAYDVAANALRMVAALSLRRGDEVSLVLADAERIARTPLHGTLAQFDAVLDRALDRTWRTGRNIGALLRYAEGIADRHAPIVLATDEHALQPSHTAALRRITRTHPLTWISVGTLNPFDPTHARAVEDGLSGRRVPSFLITPRTGREVDAHRAYATAAWEHELRRHGGHVVHADSSEAMFARFVRMVSLAGAAHGISPSVPKERR